MSWLGGFVGLKFLTPPVSCPPPPQFCWNRNKGPLRAGDRVSFPPTSGAPPSLSKLASCLRKHPNDRSSLIICLLSVARSFVFFCFVSFVPFRSSHDTFRHILKGLGGHFFRTEFRTKGGNILLDHFHSFPVKEIWRCFKNIENSEPTKGPTCLSLSFPVFLFCDPLSFPAPLHPSEEMKCQRPTQQLSSSISGI